MARKLPKFITQSQFKKMLNQINTKCATGCRNYAMLMMMYGAGLRVGEVAKLAYSDVNFETGLIYVQDSKYDKDRYVPMTDDVAEAAKAWLKFRPESDYFFCTLKGGQLDTRYIREVCYRLSDRAGIFIQDGLNKKKVSPHKLRHSFATEILKSGDFNIRELQELMGHSDISTTQIYTHVVLDDVAEKFKGRRSIAK